jgi:hypothetical protein
MTGNTGSPATASKPAPAAAEHALPSAPPGSDARAPMLTQMTGAAAVNIYELHQRKEGSDSDRNTDKTGLGVNRCAFRVSVPMAASRRCVLSVLTGACTGRITEAHHWLVQVINRW